MFYPQILEPRLGYVLPVSGLMTADLVGPGAGQLVGKFILPVLLFNSMARL